MSRERENIIKELISTEEKYLSDLNVMINVYKIPLEKSKLLPDMDIKTIFKNIPILMNVSTQLHKQVLEYYGNYFLLVQLLKANIKRILDTTLEDTPLEKYF
jgi:hypothetical protein